MTTATYIREVERKNGRRRAIFRCVCGNEFEVRPYLIEAGKQKGCGCLTGKANITHGHTRRKSPTPTYRVWEAMIRRCYNPADKSFDRYGGRGISVCEPWRRSFEDFLRDMGEAPPGLKIERINNNGPYEPANCRWATDKEQSRNRRSTVRYAFRGENLTIAEVIEKYGLKVKERSVRWRLHRGWPVESAFTQPFGV